MVDPPEVMTRSDKHTSPFPIFFSHNPASGDEDREL